MPAPKSSSGPYTPRGGLLAGQTFRSYFQYQQARSQALGFANYSQERRQRSESLFRILENRAVAAGESRNDAIRSVRRFMQQPGHQAPSGLRKHDAIAFAIDEGWADDYDIDTDDWADY